MSSAQNRSPHTEKLAAMLTDEPQTVAQLAAQVGIRPMNAAAHIRTLLKGGECREVSIDNGHGKAVRGFALPKCAARPALERGPYVPPPGPIRYEPRNVGTVRLTGCRWVSED